MVLVGIMKLPRRLSRAVTSFIGEDSHGRQTAPIKNRQQTMDWTIRKPMEIYGNCSYVLVVFELKKAHDL